MGEDCGVYIADIGGAGCVEMVEKVGVGNAEDMDGKRLE